MFGKHKDKKEKKSKGGREKESASEEEPTPTSSTRDITKTPSSPSSQTDRPDGADKAAAERQKEEERRREEEKRRLEEKKRAEEKKREEERREKEKLAAAAAAVPKKPAEPPKPSRRDEDKKKKKDDGRSDENIDAEITSLETAKLDPNESSTVYKEVYNLLPKDVFVAYDKLQNFARDEKMSNTGFSLNTIIPNPEIVFIGRKSHGKSSIVEAFFGEPINAIGYGGVTKRPFFVHMINNLNCDTPRCTLKRDNTLKEFDHDVEVRLADLHDEIAKRMKVASEEPVVLNYEYKNCCSVTFIDTPGLLDDEDSDPGVSKEERENLILNLAKPNNRIIVCVEACRDWARMEMINFVKKVDPELSRTTFVYTKFQTHLQTFTSTRDANKFLSATLPDVRTFFTTMPSEGIRAKFSDPDKYQLKIYQAYRRDINTLEQLQFDKRYEASIGIHALRRYVLNLTWKTYQEAIPRILKQLRAKKVNTQKRISELDKQLSGLDSSKLRSIGSNYVVNFLQIVERLIAGTSEGNPAVNGQTLEEEKNAHGDGDWVDLYNRVIRFEPEEWAIPYWDNKLYGGQQFERLLAEYRAVADHTEIAEVTMDDVATATGINKLNNIPNYAWAASDLAQQKSQDAFVPLIEQLTNRAVYIFKRLTDISEKILEGRKKKWLEDLSGVDDIDRYPYFTYHVKDLFYKFVDLIAKVCKEKCMDEFYSTRTIYWDLTSEYVDRNLPLERNDQEDTKTAVVNLATDIFNELRDRITKNVLLKFYNFFLVPMQSELWNEIQGKVNCLSDSALEQIFEVSATREKLKEQIKNLSDELARCDEQDKQFMLYASSFSKRVEDH